jgi:hypothetical protein
MAMAQGIYGEMGRKLTEEGRDLSAVADDYGVGH